jgi:hypothetical protein
MRSTLGVLAVSLISYALLWPISPVQAEELFDAEIRAVSVPKIRFYNNGDEVRRGPAPMRCGRRAGWRDGSERLCQETFSVHPHMLRHACGFKLAVKPQQVVLG